MEDISSYARRLNKVYADNHRPAKNLELMNKFMKKNKHSGLKPATLAMNYQVLQIFSKWCEKPISLLTEDDIFDFLDWLNDYTYRQKGKYQKYSTQSITTFKIILRKFLNNSGFPVLADVLKEKKSRKLEQKERKDLLTKQEIEILINASTLPRDKAIIASLYESGCRRGELLSSNIENLDFDENGVLVTFPESKTGKRTVRLVYAASYLRAWIEVHPCRLSSGEPDLKAPLFVSMWSKGGIYNRLSEHGLYFQIQKIAKRAGITKKVNPHAFRHARASDLAEHLTEQQLKKYLGWTAGSNMCAVYVHDPDTDNAILKMNGIEIEGTHTDGLRVGKCPRCKELNPEKAGYCLKCGLPLTVEATNTEKTAETELLKLIENSGLMTELVKKLQSQLST